MFVGTSDLQAGRLGSERLVFKLNGKGNVVFFSMPGQPSRGRAGAPRAPEVRPHGSLVRVIWIVEVFSFVQGRLRFGSFDEAPAPRPTQGKDQIDAFVSLRNPHSGKDMADALRRENVYRPHRNCYGRERRHTQDGQPRRDRFDHLPQRPYTMELCRPQAYWPGIHHALPSKFSLDYGSDPHSPYPVFIDTGTALVDKTHVDQYIKNATEAGAP